MPERPPSAPPRRPPAGSASKSSGGNFNSQCEHCKHLKNTSVDSNCFHCQHQNFSNSSSSRSQPIAANRPHGLSMKAPAEDGMFSNYQAMSSQGLRAPPGSSSGNTSCPCRAHRRAQQQALQGQSSGPRRSGIEMNPGEVVPYGGMNTPSNTSDDEPNLRVNQGVQEEPAMKQQGQGPDSKSNQASLDDDVDSRVNDHDDDSPIFDGKVDGTMKYQPFPIIPALGFTAPSPDEHEEPPNVLPPRDMPRAKVGEPPNYMKRSGHPLEELPYGGQYAPSHISDGEADYDDDQNQEERGHQKNQIKGYQPRGRFVRHTNEFRMPPLKLIPPPPDGLVMPPNQIKGYQPRGRLDRRTRGKVGGGGRRCPREFPNMPPPLSIPQLPVGLSMPLASSQGQSGWPSGSSPKSFGNPPTRRGMYGSQSQRQPPMDPRYYPKSFQRPNRRGMLGRGMSGSRSQPPMMDPKYGSNEHDEFGEPLYGEMNAPSNSSDGKLNQVPEGSVGTNQPSSDDDDGDSRVNDHDDDDSLILNGNVGGTKKLGSFPYIRALGFTPPPPDELEEPRDQRKARVGERPNYMKRSGHPLEELPYGGQYAPSHISQEFFNSCGHKRRPLNNLMDTSSHAASSIYTSSSSSSSNSEDIMALITSLRTGMAETMVMLEQLELALNLQNQAPAASGQGPPPVPSGKGPPPVSSGQGPPPAPSGQGPPPVPSGQGPPPVPSGQGPPPVPSGQGPPPAPSGQGPPPAPSGQGPPPAPLSRPEPASSGLDSQAAATSTAGHSSSSEFATASEGSEGLNEEGGGK